MGGNSCSNNHWRFFFFCDDGQCDTSFYRWFLGIEELTTSAIFAGIEFDGFVYGCGAGKENQSIEWHGL